MDPELLAALDAKTEREFYAKRKQKILLDYLIERSVGRELTAIERKAIIQRVTADLRNNAIRAQKVIRKAG